MLMRRGPAFLLALLLGLPASAAQIGNVRVVLPVNGAAPAAAAAPSLTGGSAPLLAAPGAVPTLAPSLIPGAAPQLTPAVSIAPSAVSVLPAAEAQALPLSALSGLQNLAQAIAVKPEGASPSASFTRYFDHAAQPAAGDISGPSDSPKLPPGVKSVSVDMVQTSADIERLIPSGQNSDDLKAQLKRDLKNMAPYYVYTYQDALGGRFTAIDLSAKPGLAARIPELQPHEVTLIKKIQTISKDLQVLVREDGKTPDLVVGGVVTEMKSLIGKNVDFTFLINKANTQVLEHGRRHGLGHGAAAIDLAEESQVPVESVRSDLNAWAKKATVVVDKVFVFAGGDLKVFVRRADGSFDSGPAQGPSAIDPGHISNLRSLVGAGRYEMAQQVLHKIESVHGGARPGMPLHDLREQVEGERTYLKIEKLVRTRQVAQAASLWENFALSHSLDIVKQLEPRVLAALPLFDLPTHVNIAPAPDTRQIVREIEEPPKRLREHGIRATITVYGSARILPSSQAQEALSAVLGKVTARPKSAEDKKLLKDAKRAVSNAKYYEEARKFGQLVARLGGGQLAVVTGGGPGIMEAANRGAHEAGGPSVGFNIKLPHEQSANPYLTEGLSFDFENFSTRKMSLRHGAVALVYFPGGFGTMDELFEVLTLMQTGKMQKVPIVLLGAKGYWNNILDFAEFERMGLISKGDLSLFKFVETAGEAWSAIQGEIEGAAK